MNYIMFPLHFTQLNKKEKIFSQIFFSFFIAAVNVFQVLMKLSELDFINFVVFTEYFCN